MTNEEPADPDGEPLGISGGERPGSAAEKNLKLAHQVLNRFPDLQRRYRKFVGPTAVVSSVLILLASIAIARRLSQGQSAEKIVEEITPAEIEGSPAKAAEDGASAYQKVRSMFERRGRKRKSSD